MAPGEPPDSDIVHFMYWSRTEQAILDKHMSDHTGHCTGCGTDRPVSPCDLQLVALRVAELRAAGHTPSPCSLDPGS